MLTYINKKKGQSTLEYAVLIIIIIGALLSIQVYIKRGIQGRLKSATDDIGTQFSVGNTNVIRITHSDSTSNDTFIHGVSKSTLIEEGETYTETMNAEILNAEQEFWGKKS